MTEEKYVQTHRDGPVLIATLVNPPRQMLNAAMLAELTPVVRSLVDDEEIGALVITGGADGVFLTHYDVEELVAMSNVIRERAAAQQEATNRLVEQLAIRRGELHALHQLTLLMHSLRQPVIAAINGTAMGGGCELTLGCDFRIMACGGYQLGLPEVRIGLLPGGGGTQRMTRLLGAAKAAELMLLGNTVDADEAARIGLVHRAVEPGQVVEEAVVLGKELATRPRGSVAEIKQLIRYATERPLEDGLRAEQDAFMRTMRSDDASRLMKAYLKSDRPLNEQ